MSPQMSPELFSQQPVRSDFASHRLEERRPPRRRLVLAAFVIVIAGIIGFLSFSDSTPTKIPTVKAEGPTKERPEQPGGIDIPHQDMLVFQELEKGGSQDKSSQVEHLLPPPESPQAQTPASPNASELAANTTVMQNTASSSAATTEVPAPIAAPATLVENATPATPKAEPKVEVKPEQKTEVVAPTKAAPAVTKTESPIAPAATTVVNPKESLSSSTSMPKQQVAGKLPKELFVMDAKKMAVVQLASIPDPQQAETALSRYQSKFGTQLSGTKLRLVKADLGAKGIYYRIQSGSLTDSEAQKICTTLKEQKTSCIILHP